MKNKIIYCWEFNEPECCQSCHEEFNEGYSYPFQEQISKRIIYDHCCDSKIPTFEQALKILRARKVEKEKSSDE